MGKDYSVKGKMYIIKKARYMFDKVGCVVVASYKGNNVIYVNKKDVCVRCYSANAEDYWSYYIDDLIPLEFNVGDIVKVRTLEEMCCRRDDIRCHFTGVMDKFCEKYAKITNIEYEDGDKFKDRRVYLQFVDNKLEESNFFNFSAEMITKDISECKNNGYGFLVGENGILLQTPEEYKYLARDIDGNLCIFKNKPTKGQHYWESDDFEYFTIFNHLFENVKFDDKEPYKFR